MLPIMPTPDVPIWLNSVLLHTTVENTTETRDTTFMELPLTKKQYNKSSSS